MNFFNKIKLFLRKIKAQFFLSSLISYSFVFPVLNSLELIIWSTQKTFAIYCLILNLFLFIFFIFSPSFYDFIINFLFKDYSLISLNLFSFGCKSLKKHPYLSGIFFSFCFLAITLKWDFTNNSFIFWVSSFSLIVRNLIFLPSIGYFSVARWSINHIQKELLENKISQEIVFKSFNEKNFEIFSKNLSSLIPFCHPKRLESYNLTARRNMFRWVQKTYEGIPTAREVKKVVETSVGATITGSVGISTWIAGSNTKTTVNDNLANVHTWCQQGFQAVGSTKVTDEVAVQLLKQARDAQTLWASSYGQMPATVVGIQRLTGFGRVNQQQEHSVGLALAGSKLVSIVDNPNLTSSQKNEMASELLKSTPEFKGPFSVLEFENGFSILFQKIKTLFII